MKKITSIILFILIQFSPPGVLGSDGDKYLTNGFTVIEHKGEGKNKEFVDFLKEAANGVPFNDILKETILDTFNAGINHQLEKLKSCMGGDYSKKIEAKEKTGKIDLRFDDNLGLHEGYHEEATKIDNENVTLSGSYLEKIIGDITGNKNWRPDNIYTLPGNTDFLTVIGHEMIHSHAGIGGGQMNECMAHCYTKQCLNSKHDPRDFQYSVVGGMVTNPLNCDQLKFPPEVKNKMGEGKCFCGVNWEAPDDNNPCKDEKPAPPQSGSGGSSGTTETEGSYNLDPPDDHYSYSDFIAFSGDEMNSNPGGNFPGDTFNDMLCFNYYPDVLIYAKYGNSLMEHLLNRVMPGNYIADYTHDYFSNNHKVLVIPSAALMGDSGSETIRQAIKRFVENGNSVIVFTQQYGKDIENLIPMTGGEIGPIIGFREDSSCLKNSVYFTGMHPILSSSTTGKMDVGIDGYAAVNSTSTATVLLRRKANSEPALLYYKYGLGTVYLYFGFTDYAYPRSMAGTQEIKLVKNMFRHAVAPDAYIPMFNLDENPNPTISFNTRVTNYSGTPAAKAKISVYTIENTLLHETEVPVNLNQGDSTDIPITFTLPDLVSKDYGIGYTVFELTDADGNLSQLKTETPSGRFSIYKLITPADIDGGLYR